MRLRVTFAAVLACAFVDLARGFGLLGTESTRSAERATSRAEMLQTVPAADPGPSTTIDAVASAPDAAADPFFVTDVLAEPPNGAYGSWSLALDGHSDAFAEFQGGDARIAIHGTNDPSSIGRAASFGCVRVDADTLARLAAAIAPGTPVVIH